ncbi:hypothetical protein IQ268_15425 [Oculatella sp. LEGE 06141]|uniref:hypothetical protein n=1 Tax=Oculatella sp. LEGE 06141 TaxID=1828648 RepID=UPI00187F12EC|nr:hypothetical protein [Oculatella sp. LEGE 06141]MBE9179962.1 hypothetical protein [Oculatella sp. LEGE 06141]
MSVRCVACSGILTCAIGAVLGVAVAEINQGDLNPQAPRHYAIVGSVLGLAIGSGQEAIRQLDREEAE